MATKVVYSRIGTAAAFTIADPILALGESGYEQDTGRVKVGDGATAWTALDYSFESTVVESPAGTFTFTDSFGATATWVIAAAGETNTASNIGVGGVGIFVGKVGVDLQFKSINVGSNKVTVTNDGPNNEIDIDIVPGNIGTSELNNDANFIDASGAPVQPADIADFETTAQLNIRDAANRDRANHTGTQLAATISDLATAIQAGETDTTLTKIGNLLRYIGEDGVNQDVDLSIYLDDTNLAQLVSGSIDGAGIATFVRDDSSSFTIDFSSLFDDTNLARLVSGAIVGSDLVLTRDDSSMITIDVSALLDNQIASEVPVTPTGNLSSTNTQAALEELQSDIDSLSGATGDHGLLTGLGDDDHTQYLTEARHDTLPFDNPHNVNATQVGLGNVDNTSDANKPVSTAQQTAIDDAEVVSGTFSIVGGNITLTKGDSSTVVISTASLSGTLSTIQGDITDLESYVGGVGALDDSLGFFPGSTISNNIGVKDALLEVEAAIEAIPTYTHPNHTGEVTSVSDGVQTLDPTSITNKTTVTPVSGDFGLFSDTSDGGALKKFNMSEVLGGAGAIVGDLPSILITSTNTFALPNGSYSDIPFNQTTNEPNSTVLEHNNTNNDRMDFKEDGLYLVGYNLSVDRPNNSSANLQITSHVRVNDTTILNQSIGETTVFMDSSIPGSAHEDNIQVTFLYYATAGDFLTVQGRHDVIGGTAGVDLENDNQTFWATKLQGQKGDTGATGPGGGSNWQKTGTTLNPLVSGDGVRIGDLNPISAGFKLEVLGDVIEKSDFLQHRLCNTNAGQFSKAYLQFETAVNGGGLAADYKVLYSEKTDAGAVGGSDFSLRRQNPGSTEWLDYITMQENNEIIFNRTKTAGRTYGEVTFKNSNVNFDQQVKISGGSPGVGKVLTSNATGLATWENSSSTFGQGFQESASLSQSTTNSTAWQQKLNLTTPSLPSGKYRIGVSYSWSQSSTGADFEARVQLNNTTTYYEHEQEPQDSGVDQLIRSSGFFYLTGSGVFSLDLDYRTDSGSTTSYIRDVRLEIWRVS